jgi:membrane fusion protein (multidrug efflux system)
MTAATLAFAACSKSARDEAVQAVVNVRTAVVTQQPFTETIGAIGVVTGRAGHMASVSAPTPARVVNVMVSVGQRVGAGTALVELDQTPFVAAARAAEAALAAAEKTFERTQRLAQEGIAPRKDLDQAATELERARAEAANARRHQELSLVRAPIGGVVTHVGASLGATADPSQVLVEIADPSALDILFNVTPSQAGLVQRGAKITLSAGQNAQGEPLGVATVADVGGVVDTVSRGVTIRAQAPTTRRPLRIGETVFGRVVAVVHPAAIVVPIEALVPDGEEFKVFVVDAAGTARARTVIIGGRTDKVAEVTEGLTVGEKIVTYGAYGIEDSAKVVPIGTPVKP